MPTRTRHVWASNEVITKTLLNALGGQLLAYDELTVAHGVNTTTDAVMSKSLNLSANRLLLLTCSGPTDIDPTNSGTYSAQLKVSFAASIPTDPTGTITNFETAFVAYGFRDAANNVHKGEYRTAVAHYVTVAGGTYTFALNTVDIGTGGLLPQLNAGFRFYIQDCGSSV